MHYYKNKVFIFSFFYSFSIIIYIVFHLKWRQNTFLTMIICLSMWLWIWYTPFLAYVRVCVCGLKIFFLIYASCFSCLGGGVDDNQKLKGKPYIIYRGGEGKTNNNKIRGNK